MPVDNTYILSYSEGNDQEDCNPKLVLTNTLQDPALKTHHNKGLVEWLKV
jgi:hypothetical protein